MKAQPFTDAVLGEFKPDKKGSSKTHHCFSRQTTIKLHKIHAQDYFDVESGKQQHIWGTVTLIEKKLVDKNNSASSLFREVHKTPDSLVEDVIL